MLIKQINSYKPKNSFLFMEKEKQVEFILGEILIVIVLAAIILLIYSTGNSNANQQNYNYYQRSSSQVLRNGIYYGNENIYSSSYNNNVYKTQISKTTFLNIQNKFILEREVSFEKTSGESDLIVSVN